MKLANALAERARLQQHLIDLGNRLNNNAKVQSGDEPAENPQELLREVDETLCALEALIAKINLVNSTTRAGTVTLTELLAKRDCLKMRLSLMRGFLENASRKVDRYTKTEIAILSTVPVSQLQKQVDDYSAELRRVDEQIQELNWTTEL